MSHIPRYSPDLGHLRDVPGYQAILKSVLKSQIQFLVEQLSEQTGEESVLLTASVTDGTLSHLGSNCGKFFLKDNEEFKSKFLGFCLKQQLKRKPEEPTEVHEDRVPLTKRHRKYNNHQNLPSATHHHSAGYINDNGSYTCNTAALSTDTLINYPPENTHSDVKEERLGIENAESVVEKGFVGGNDTRYTGYDDCLSVNLDKDLTQSDETNDSDQDVVVVKKEPPDSHETGTSKSGNYGLEKAPYKLGNAYDSVLINYDPKVTPYTQSETRESWTSDTDVNSFHSLYKLPWMKQNSTEQITDGTPTSLNRKASMSLTDQLSEATPSNLNMYQNHEMVGVKCDICGKVMKHRRNLQRHILQHSGAKPYECKFCGKRFTQKQSMKTHALVHLTNRDCDASYFNDTDSKFW